MQSSRALLMKHFRLVVLFIAITLTKCFSGGASAVDRRGDRALDGSGNVQVIVDFAVHCDPPLVKKFGLMNSGIVPLARYQRDISKLALLRAQSFRVDLSIGKQLWLGNLIGGSASAIRYDWSEIDQLSHALDRIGTPACWSFCYVPRPFQGADGWRGFPTDLFKWAQTAEVFTRHFRQEKLRAAYYEVWNEPDNPEFFRGTRNQYFEMYRAAAIAMRKGDPDALVGGPGLAYSLNWIAPFVEFVKKNHLPLDFFSYHSVGGSDTDPPKEEFALTGLQTIRRALATNPYFNTTEIHLNEYNPYDSEKSHLTDQPALAARMLSDFELFLNWTDVTAINWAQFSDPGVVDRYGLLDVNGQPKPAYGAFAIYADMPIDRVKVTGASAGSPIRCMASLTNGKACAVLWNTQPSAQTVAVRMEHVRFSNGRAEIYRIDQMHSAIGIASAGRVALAPFLAQRIAGKTFQWRGQIPGNSVVYLKLLDANAPPAFSTKRVGRIVSIRHFFASRAGGTEYAFFDRSSRVARLGMGDAPQSPAVLAVTLDRLPKSLRVSCTENTPPARGKGGQLFIRIDYHTPRGYARAVQFTNGNDKAPNPFTPPWGTKRPADNATLFKRRQHTQLQLANFAPPDWDGQAIITFDLAKTDPGTWAKIKLGDGPSRM